MVSFANNQKLKLPKPSELAMNISATQIVKAQYKTKSYTTETAVEVTPKKIVLVALSGMGTPLYTLVYNGRSIKTSYLPVPHISEGAKQSLLSFILSYSPESVLHKMLKGSGIMLRSVDKQRLFIYDNKLIIKITYQNANPWEGSLLLENQLDNYRVNIDTISVSKHK
jgi:hypothetical protein